MENRQIKKVTVGVVSYNHSRYVVECLDSIREQEIEAEVLIIDDNSPDNTADIIEEYLDRYPGFATFYKNSENQGLNKNLNFLLAQASGEYFTYISADDFMMPNRIKKHVEILEKDTSLKLAYSNAAVVDGDSRVLAEDSKDEFPWPASNLNRTDAQYSLLQNNWIPAASIFMSTNFLREIGGYNEKIYFEDFELLTRAAQRTQFAWTEEHLVAVRRLETSLGATTFGQKNPKFLYAAYIAYANYANNPRQELREKSLFLRWNLAVRMIDLSTPRWENLKMLWFSRKGATNTVSLCKQLLRAALKLSIGR